MNSLEAEYSFLAPTWKLPTVVTPSIYSRSFGTSYLSSVPNVGPDWALWNNTAYNAGYIPAYTPSSTLARNYPLTTNYNTRSILASNLPRQRYPTTGDRSTLSGPPYYQQGAHNAEDGLNLTISLHPNNELESFNDRLAHNQQNYPVTNRGSTYATNPPNNYVTPNQKRRVQIVDHNRQTPSTTINDNMSGVMSRNSNNAPSYTHYNRTPDPRQSQQKSKTYASYHNHDPLDDNKPRPNGDNQNIHEYLYGLSVPDPGSYTDAFKQHQRRLQEEKLGRKSVVSEYKSFAKNGGFGPSFGHTEHQTHDEKAENERKRKNYAKVVHETNHYKIEEQKRFQNNNQPKARPAPVPKYQRAREYAEGIEKPQHTKPVVRLRDPYSGNIIIRDASHQHRQRIYS